MKEVKLSMKKLLSAEEKFAQAKSESSEPEQDFAETFTEEAKEAVIPVSYVKVDRIIVPEIKDVKGRLSDIVESIEEMCNVSVVPLEMTCISSSVKKLQRHEIFELSGKRYAMSKTVREGVINRYVERIQNTLATGMPFVENLMTAVTYNDVSYKTIALSRNEWTLILSMFRAYRQSLSIRGGTDIILTIDTEMIE